MKSSVSKKQLREFGFLIGFGMPILVGWIIPAIGGHLFRTWTFWISVPSLIIGILRPGLLFYPYKVWMSLGLVLGWINSRVILGLVYFIVLLPIALIMKIFGYDPLRIKRSDKKSYMENKKDHEVNLKRIF